MNATDTLDTLKSGTTTLAESAGSAVGELAGSAKKQASAVMSEMAERLAEHLPNAQQAAPKRRRGRLLVGVAVIGAGAAWLSRRTGLGRRVQEQVIDLTGRGRTDEATVERMASEGLDPVARGGSVT